MLHRLMWVVVTGALISGCASVSTMGLARTLNAGAVQGWVAPGGGGVVATVAGQTAAVGYPMVEGGVRFGVTDHFELGAKLGLSGIGLEGKVALIRAPSMDSGFNLSLNPGATFVGIGGGGAFAGSLTFHLPVLLGIDFSGHELVIGPRLINQLIFGGVNGTSAVVNVLYAGGSIGVAFRAGPSVRILPEVSLGVPFLGSATGAGTAALGGGLIFQAGIGILFGSPDAYERAVPLPAPPPPPQLPPTDSPPPVGP